MLVFLSIFTAGVLLLCIIIFLHKMQVREKTDSVDRTVPLPPLDVADRQRVLSIKDPLSSAFAEEDIPAADTSGWLTRLLRALDADTPAAGDWLAQSKYHAARHDYDLALAYCARAFPQMGAFRQSALLLRARIRALRKSGATYSEDLEVLYKVAAWADLLHGKWDGNPPPSSPRLKHLDLHKYQGLTMDYMQLGYRELALLGASDWKLLVECWGEPSAHRRARDIHGEALVSMLEN